VFFVISRSAPEYFRLSKALITDCEIRLYSPKYRWLESAKMAMLLEALSPVRSNRYRLVLEKKLDEIQLSIVSSTHSNFRQSL
jgi:hypothetical protein